jgi:hypothetical protein
MSNEDSVDTSEEAGGSSTSLKYNYDKTSDVARDLNVTETESDTNTETHEGKVYAIVSSDRGHLPANVESSRDRVDPNDCSPGM